MVTLAKAHPADCGFGTSDVRTGELQKHVSEEAKKVPFSMGDSCDSLLACAFFMSA